MSLIDRVAICDSLRELSDLNLQKQLWLSDGSQGKDVSSFEEAVEELFTDTGLADSLHKGRTGLGREVDNLLRALMLLVGKVNVRQGPLLIIEDPIMVEIRYLASSLLKILM
jgi:hypothetical protein